MVAAGLPQAPAGVSSFQGYHWQCRDDGDYDVFVKVLVENANKQDGGLGQCEVASGSNKTTTG